MYSYYSSFFSFSDLLQGSIRNTALHLYRLCNFLHTSIIQLKTIFSTHPASDMFPLTPQFSLICFTIF